LEFSTSINFPALRCVSFGWSWDDAKPWIGLGNRCTRNDYKFFADTTRETISNGEKAPFWELSWIDGVGLEIFHHTFFGLSHKKKSTIRKALDGNFWVSQINVQNSLSAKHIFQFF
jgi:hypothetical protein